MLVIEHWVRFLSHLGLNGIFFWVYLQIKRKILAAQDSVKQFIFGPKGEPSGKEPSDTAK
jgi:hypothetical protein